MKRAIFAALSLCLVACGADRVRPPLGRDSDHESTPRRGGWLHGASISDARSLDAAVAFDEVSSIFEQLLYAKLIDYAPDGKTFVPDLAERWSMSEDGKRYVFHLRSGALFHDGTEVTASDVKRSLERALHHDTPNPASSFYERIRGYPAFNSGKAPHLDGVIVEGTYDVAIELSEADATMLAVLALPTAAPVCKSAGSTYDREFSLHPCGAGPYKLASWDPGRTIRVERFDGYWQKGLPYLDGIEWSLSVPTFNQRFKFEAGAIDFIRELSEADLLRYQESAEWKGRGAWDASKAVHAVFLNTELPPFDNIEVRRAVSFAIDREHIAMLRPGTIRPSGRIIPPGIPGHNAAPGQRFDRAEALAHMNSAGFPFDPRTNAGGYPKEIVYITQADSLDERCAELVQEDLAAIGLRIRLRAVGFPTYLADSGRRRSFAMGTDGWAADFPDPSDFFEPLFTKEALTDEDSQNRAFYQNAALDDLLTHARRETNWETRAALYRRAEDTVLNDAPWAVLYTNRWFELWHPYLHGYQANPAMSEHVGLTWIDDDARKRALSARFSPPFSRDRLALLLARTTRW